MHIVVAGDTGTMVSKAVLTAGNPEGDVMWGVDNTFLSRVVDGDVFEPYAAAGLDDVPAALRDGVGDGDATPVDFGDVCVNDDMAWFAEHDLDPPADLEALADPAYSDLLVVENPATSSPGLAFLLATIARYGDDGWADYWHASPPTASRSSTAGPRPTTTASAAPATATARSSSATARARRPRCCSPIRRSTRRPPGSSPTPASARSSSPACSAAPMHPTRRTASSTSC